MWQHLHMAGNPQGVAARATLRRSNGKGVLVARDPMQP
jgi:hypothetical protein